MGDERVAETWVGMRLKREEREIYLPLACPVELLRTIACWMLDVDVDNVAVTKLQRALLPSFALSW